MLWTLDPAERDAFLANEATKKWTSSNQVLAEIACSRSSHDLLLARQAYHSRYKKSLEEDVAHHTTGDFRKVHLLIEDLQFLSIVLETKINALSSFHAFLSHSKRAVFHFQFMKMPSQIKLQESRLLARLVDYNKL